MLFENQRLRQLIDLLHDNNIDSYISLPQIAVMGDTSSGKSSLLTALSGIQFPAHAKLTTRCPTRLHMQKSSQANEYQAEIKIKWDDSSSYAEEFDNVSLVGNDSFLEIPSAIEKAQDFIIQCSSKEVAFDVIEVMIVSPDCLDLTLIDLPGIVRSVGKDESKDIVGDIHALINRYLKNERCIILAVIPANVDFHNSQIMADARLVDPSTQRTIPVITKPDLIDAGSEKEVLDLLLGLKTQEFDLGFHMTKCRGQKDLSAGVSIVDGLANETRYFFSKEPWSSVHNRTLFGTNNLRIKLADLQIELLKTTIPDICKEITSKKDKALKELNDLGQDFAIESNRREVFRNKLKYLENIISRSNDGLKGSWIDDKGFTFRALLENAYTTFGDKILTSELASFGDIVKGSDVEVDIDEVQCKGKIIEKIVRENETFYYIAPVKCIYYRFFYNVERGCFNKTSHKEIPECQVSLTKNLDFIQLIKLNRKHNLPIFLSSEAFSTIVDSLIERDWVAIIEDLLNQIFDIYNEFSEFILQESANQYTSRLDLWIENKVNAFIGDLKENTKNEINKIVVAEKVPFTQNHYLFDNFFSQDIDKMMKLIKNTAPNGSIPVSTVETILNHRKKMSCEQHMQNQMMNVLKAYGKVAAKRVIDLIPMKIEDEFVEKIVPKLIQLDLNDNELEKVLSESNHVQKLRKKLIKEIEDLNLAEKTVDNLLYL